MVSVGEMELWAWVQNNDDADRAPVSGTIVTVRFDSAAPSQIVPLMHESRTIAMSPLYQAMAHSHAMEFGVDVRLVHLREVDDDG